MSLYPPLASTIQFTIDGRPSVHDIHELFSTMIFQLNLSTHRYMLRSYRNTFTSEEAIKELAVLKFSSLDHQTTTTTIFNMAKEMAKALIQQFLWTRLIESATEPQNRTYRDKGLWRVRSKGLCVLQDFCLRTKSDIWRLKKNVSNAELMYLIELERTQNDRIQRQRKYMATLFTILIASLPLKHQPLDASLCQIQKDFGVHSDNAPSLHSSCDSGSFETKPRHLTDLFPNMRILANDLLVDSDTGYQQHQALLHNLSPTYYNKFKMRAIFSSKLCCNWLVEYCTVSSTDEAETVMTEFLKLGWITFFDRKNDHLEEVESSKSVILKLTKTGMNVIMDESLNTQRTVNFDFELMSPPVRTPRLSSGIDYFSMSTDYFSDLTTPPLTPTCSDETLKQILKDGQQTLLFREHLEMHGKCVRDLDFLVDYDLLHRRCQVSLVTNQKQLFEDARVLWDAYFKRCELSVDETLKKEMSISLEVSYQNLLKMLTWFDKVNDQLQKIISESLDRFIKSQYKIFELDDFPPPPSR